MDKSNNSSNKTKNFIIKNLTSIFFLLLLTIIVSVIAYLRVSIQIEIGLLSDSVDFFTNALVFAGKSFGYSDLIRPPLFSFITSLFVRMGYTSINTIFGVDAIMYVFGVIGMYVLLKIRFNDIESFLGGLIYGTFPIVITVLGVGFSDLASVSFTIWTMYFLIMAIKKDSRFFYLAFPFAMFSFLTRYNNALLIFPIFLYILINRKNFNYKNFLGGIAASFLAFIPVLVFYYLKFGNALYPFINFESTSTESSTTAVSVAYNSNIFYFLQNLPAFIGAQGITILIILLLGCIVLLFSNFIKKSSDKDRNIWKNLEILISQNKIKFSLLLVFLILFFGSFGKIWYMLSELIFFITAYVFYEILKSKDIKHLNIHLLFLSWFMAFFIFHSVFVIKDYRYFILMAPPVAYFMILGLSEISKKIDKTINNRNITFPFIAVLLTSMILFSTATQLPIILESNSNKKAANQDMVMASQWMENNVPDYKEQLIFGDLWPNLSWYLRMNVQPVFGFKDGKVYTGGVDDNNFTQQDSNTYDQYLTKNNADYYFSIRQGLNLTSYKPIKQFGILIIYKRI